MRSIDEVNEDLCCVGGAIDRGDELHIAELLLESERIADDAAVSALQRGCITAYEQNTGRIRQAHREGEHWLVAKVRRSLPAGGAK